MKHPLSIQFSLLCACLLGRLTQRRPSLWRRASRLRRSSRLSISNSWPGR